MKREDGQALILVLILLAVGAVMITPLLQLAGTVSKSRQTYGQFIKEDYAADAAIEYGMWRLKYEPGFTASLPVGMESQPFYITLNGVEASTTVVAQAPAAQLSGQDLAGRAEDKVFFKVTKTVVASATYLVLAADGFESASGSGGTGSWVGNWSLTGTYSFSTSGPHEGSYHLRLRGDDNLTPGDGYAQRKVNLSGSSGQGPFLHFWARASSFESGDSAKVKVSLNGIDWDVLRVFTSSDSSYVNYVFDLSSYGAPSSFYVAFETTLSSSGDSFYVDDLRFVNTQQITSIEPGVLTEYTYYVTIQNLDPNGATLRRILDILPDRIATSGDYLQYINGSTQWTQVLFESYAFDGFESASGSGGSGAWSGNWTLSGDYAFDTSGEYQGNYHLRLRSNNGYAQRKVDLSGSIESNSYLYFWARLKDFESGDEASIKVSTNGVDWNVLRTFVNGEDDDTYHQYSFDLSGYGAPSEFYLAFDANMSDTGDYFYIDNVEFSGFQGTGTGEWPMPAFDPTDISTNGSGSTLHQELVWDFEQAGYGYVWFAYGETKTFSFKVQAALQEGVYCNEISLRSIEGWPDILSGRTAPIIVGDPADTRCSGGLLTIDKTADPLIIYPNEPTTVTYTVTIENVDTTAIRIYEIEDWLPSTGSADPEASFIYVDGSTTGRIIGLHSVAFDGFESASGSGGTGAWSGNWTLSGDYAFNTSGAYQGAYHLRLRSSTGYARRVVNLSGYPNAQLRFWAKLDSFESGDTAVVQVSTNGVNWTTLRTFVNGEDDNKYHQYVFDLSGYGAPSTFYLAFDANMSSTDDYFYVDYVEFFDPSVQSETTVAMPDSNSGADFFVNPDGHGDWHSDSRRWELDWLFSNYPGPTDPIWQPGGLYEGLYADYNPYLTLNPGEIFEITFQTTVTLSASGSYYNEVFVRIDQDGDTEWLYSWPVAGVTVPQYDLQAETLNSILRAAAMLQADGHWWRSWHWKKHR